MSTQSALWSALRTSGVSPLKKGARDVMLALKWIVVRQDRILDRFDPDQNDAHTLEGMDYWEDKMTMYLHRARVLGLDSPQGRQAVAECAATAVGMLASLWRVWGPPPSQPMSPQRKVE